MKRLYVNPAKTAEVYCRREKMLRTRNCRREFIKNLLREKPKENMKTKKPWFKSRLNNVNFFSDDMGLVNGCLNNNDDDDPEIITHV